MPSQMLARSVAYEMSALDQGKVNSNRKMLCWKCDFLRPIFSGVDNEINSGAATSASRLPPRFLGRSRARAA